MKRSMVPGAHANMFKLPLTLALVAMAALAFALGFVPLAVLGAQAVPGASPLNMTELLDLLLYPKAFTQLTLTYPTTGLDIVVPADAVQTGIVELTAVAESDDPAATNNVGFGVDGTRSASNVFFGPVFGRVFTEPYFHSISLRSLQNLVGTHEMYALGNIQQQFGAQAFQYQVISSPVYFNVRQVTADTDIDDDGLPDDPFNLVNPGEIWISSGESGREVIVANLDEGAKAVSPTGAGVAVLMDNLTIEAPTRDDLLAEGLIEADSEALLVVAGAADLPTLLADPDWAARVQSAVPSELIPINTTPAGLKQYVEISIIYTINGGLQYRQIEQLTPVAPVRLSMDSLLNSANGKAAAFWSFDTEIRDEFIPEFGSDVMIIGEVPGAGWNKTAPSEVIAQNRIAAELTSLSVFAPFTNNIRVTAITPNEGPKEGIPATITGSFTIDAALSLAEAQAQYEVRIGGRLAAFDPSAGAVVTPTSIRILVPPRPELAVTTRVDVVVSEVGDPLNSATIANAFTYKVTPPPTITTVSPNAGPVTGGTTVAILGTSFTGVTEVLFDGIPAADVTPVSATEITVTTPAHTAGAVDVTVVTPSGTVTSVNAFTYFNPPQVLFLQPVEGPVTGGTTVTITGRNFLGTNITVLFGDVPAAISSQMPTRLTVVTPAQTAGTVDVTVTTSGGASVLANAFTFLAVGAPPSITDARPVEGPATGGTTVTITGANFSMLQVVAFGGVPASVVSVAPTQIVVLTGPHAPGIVDIVVRTLNGTATKARAFTYTPVGNPPTLTTINPTAGPTAGGTTVTLNGANLATAQSVAFGGVAATNLTIVSSTRLTVVTPPHNAGPVDVSVTTAGGEATLANAFTFRDPRLNVFDVSPNKAWAFGGIITRIEGFGFTEQAAGDPTVTFGGIQAQVLAATDTELIVKVPPRMLPDGSPASTIVDVVVSKTAAGQTFTGTRSNAFTYQHFVQRTEMFGNQSDTVVTTAFFLEGGVGSHEIILRSMPAVPKGRVQFPQGLRLGDVGVLVRATKSPAVFGLTQVPAGLPIQNVWYYDLHLYVDPNTAFDPLFDEPGDVTYEEILDLEFTRGNPVPVLTIPVADTDLTGDQLTLGKIALFAVESRLTSPPMGTSAYSVVSAPNYQSQPLADEFVLNGDDEPTSIRSRIYQTGAFALRADVVPDLSALNLRLDDVEHPDGAEGPTSGGTRVVMLADGGLGWVDRVLFRINGDTAEAEILTEPATTEFMLVVESPAAPRTGNADIEVYLLADPDTPAGVLNDAFVYDGGGSGGGFFARLLALIQAFFNALFGGLGCNGQP